MTTYDQQESARAALALADRCLSKFGRVSPAHVQPLTPADLAKLKAQGLVQMPLPKPVSEYARHVATYRSVYDEGKRGTGGKKTPPDLIAAVKEALAIEAANGGKMPYGTLRGLVRKHNVLMSSLANRLCLERMHLRKLARAQMREQRHAA